MSLLERHSDELPTGLTVPTMDPRFQLLNGPLNQFGPLMDDQGAGGNLHGLLNAPIAEF